MLQFLIFAEEGLFPALMFALLTFEIRIVHECVTYLRGQFEVRHKDEICVIQGDKISNDTVQHFESILRFILSKIR